MTDPFKEKLLVALKDDIASREAVPAAAPRSHRRRWFAGGLATAALAGIAVFGVPMLGEAPAYAVDREPDGSIKIEFNLDTFDRDGVEGFERKLRFFGVNAEVDWLDNGQACASPRGDEVAHTSGDGPPYWPAPLWESEPGEGADENPFWRIRPEYLQPGQTLVWELEVYQDGDSGAIAHTIRVVNGPVPPCQIVPGQLLGDPTGGN